MDYFQKFLRQGSQPPPRPPTDYAHEFHKSWNYVKNTLLYPDERQLSKGIYSTEVPSQLQSMVDSLVLESTRTEEGATGACLEYLLKNDVLGTLVRLSESDRPFGIQAEVLRAVQNMVVLLDEQFLVHSAVHKAVLRLLRSCVGDDLQEQLDGRKQKVMGAAGAAMRSQPSEYEEDLVNLLCILCSRIRTYRELLMIFFHDKHWYRTEPLFSVEEEEEDEEEDAPAPSTIATTVATESTRSTSPTPSQATITSAPASSATKKPEYEFLLFNYLLRFVHREGQIGDFARAGLLFLMDVAMSPGEQGQPSQQPGEAASTTSQMDPMDSAAAALADYILDGDFSDVLGAGLGAVYSVLPSKLQFHPPTDDAPKNLGMTIGGLGPETEDEKEMLEVLKAKARAMGVEDANNPDFKAQLDHFLKLLEFLQDILRRNNERDSSDASSAVGSAIVQSILDSVRRIFLENVFYPKVLECSDKDGSAVAVMSYIEVMIRTLRDGQLADLLVNFLISEDNDQLGPGPRPRYQSTVALSSGSVPPQAKSASGPPDKRTRRKSSAMVLLEMEAPDAKKQTEYFTSTARFTLKDLLLDNLRSNSMATSTSALQLLQSVLLQHPHVCIEQLLKVIPDMHATSFPHPAFDPSYNPDLPLGFEDDDDSDSDDNGVFSFPIIGSGIPTSFAPAYHQPNTTYSTHEREMGLYLNLISRVDPSHNADPFSTGYDHYLRDALISIQGQRAFFINPDDNADAESRKALKHRLNVNDSILVLLLESLRKFFSNTPEHNIALTGVLATLAMHPDRSLAGWMTFAPSNASLSSDRAQTADDFPDEDGDDRSIDFRIEEKLSTDSNVLPASSLDEQSRPILHSIFHGLVAQLELYRQTLSNFDKFLLERRQGLLFSENLSDALSLGWDIPDEPGKLSLPMEQPPPKPKPKLTDSSTLVPSKLVSFLTPKKSRSKTTAPSDPTTPTRSGGSRSVSASPFAPHYQQTGSITVEPYIAPAPSSGVWTPSKSRKWNADEEDVFTSGWGDKSAVSRLQDAEDDGQPRKKLPDITLSQLLDNVVILEESMKELVAIIHARRSLGIDAVRYL